ncbi:MAG: hypothetical protein ACI9LY_000614 [Arenicella sp.]|jgi:hypothetical protein
MMQKRATMERNKQALHRIFYAEDDLDIQPLVSLLLTQAGYVRLKMCRTQ